MKVSLICPTNYYGESATRSIYYPMGILLVGSLIKDSFPSWDVSVIDGELYSTKELEQKLDSVDVLGLSANTNNYPLCLELAKFAKDHGTKRVILGGPHATALPRQILQNQPSIDGVIVNDGEESLLELLAGKDLSKIVNLYWRNQNGNIRQNGVIPPTKPPRFIDMNFSLMSFEPYWREHKEEFPEMDEKFIEGFTHVGCTWRVKAGCKFCDIPYPFNNYQAPGRFWRDFQEARGKLGVRSFKDYGDCLTGNYERVKALLESRPSSMDDTELSCYGRSVEITEEMADLLKELNVRYVYIGFDSGSTKMLQAMRQGYALKHNYQAAERMAKRGINITGSLILGADGESEETIAETEKFAREMAQIHSVTQLHCAVLNIFPGSPYGAEIRRVYPHLQDDDKWDVMDTQRLWADKFCSVSQEYLHERAKEINNLNPSSRKRYFGIKKET